ncbi:MAG: hypothetical protein IJY72_08195 [Akkermansia sp.]|nr:hypothetical protein [Akkermansia sp.]
MTTIISSSANASVSKKNPIAFDIFSNTLTILGQYYKKSMVYGSAESIALKTILNENPGCNVVIVESNKQSYKGVSQDLIKEFISYHTDKVRLEAEYNSLEKAEGEDDPEFPLAKKWFLKNFPKMTAEKMNQYISNRKIELAETEAAASLKIVEVKKQSELDNAANM